MTVFPALLCFAAAQLRVGSWTAPTYGFGDPDPVPCTETTRYPYSRFDSCERTATPKAWTTVELENDKLLVTILPQIGGRIWGVKDKTSGRELVYFNHAVKFRNIAQRGAWVSGGIELNFGIIGHSPITATPVDWTTRENDDGSVSYFVRMRELICRTEWQVEVRLAPGDEFFTTSVLWHNASNLPSPYYQWMTAAFPAAKDARFYFPGTEWIGHEGDAHAWPRDAAGHDLSRYAENAFGHNKSYHILNGDPRYFGVWYPSWDVGFLHENKLGEKFGRKIWLWSQAREGAIWEDLLTDADGQYVELQSGRCFNQPRRKTVETPFKHATFAPGCVDEFTEKWRVVRSWDALEQLSRPEDRVIRPTTAPSDFDWTTAYGHYVRGQQLLRERYDEKGLAELDMSLKKEPCFLPALTEKAALEFRRGRYAETRRLCAKALAIDTYDPKANYLDGYAALVLDERTTAKERLGLAAFSPEYRAAAQALAERASGIVESAPAGFVDCGEGRCEYPGETAAERATPYEEARQLDKALALLAKSDSPVCDLRRAYWLDRLERKDEAAAVRRSALAKPVAGVFPFRREERAPLEAAVRACPDSWKAAYYLAVLESFFGEPDKARNRLAAYGATPDEWVFYAYRARNSADPVADLLRAEELGGDWRIGRDLMTELTKRGRFGEAVEAGERYLKHYPAKNALELPYARALQLDGRNRDCVEFLKTVDVLPSEFGDNAHEIWADAWRALGDENKGREFPENLGAGAPYPAEDFDTVSAWVTGVKWARGANKDRQSQAPTFNVRFRLADGSTCAYSLGEVDFKGRFFMHRRFTPDELNDLSGAKVEEFFFKGLTDEDKGIRFEDARVYKEEMKPIAVEQRAKRNLTPMKGQDVGFNTGAGTLPFPVSGKDVVPSAARAKKPCALLPQFNGGSVNPLAEDALVKTVRREGCCMIVDLYAPAGAVKELSLGSACETSAVKRVRVPYLDYGDVDVLSGGFFRYAFFDWYRSNASRIDEREVNGVKTRVAVYLPKTDGSYNPVCERIVVTLSDEFADVLPEIPNPKSKFKATVAPLVWRSHAAFDRPRDKALWQKLHDAGIRNMAVTDHETMWRDGGEAFTFLTEAAKGKGGDAVQRDYTRFMNDTLGYVYGPYNNYTDFAPSNALWWDIDRVMRNSDGSLRKAWMRCYTPKPSVILPICERIVPAAQAKFGFTGAYCDVHTSFPPWWRTDYDARCPGAATFSQTYYAYGELLLRQKELWNGPVWSEGGMHFMYAGLADGNYARDGRMRFYDDPWLVDFDLRKIHPLETDFGMGSLSHFSPGKDGYALYMPDGREALVDLFIGATLAFGHAGYLVADWMFDPPKMHGLAYGGGGRETFDSGLRIARKSYFMTQAIAARYANETVEEIHYYDACGVAQETSEAILTDAYRRRQIYVRYTGGVHVLVNGHASERLRAAVGGETYDLPPRGYRAWTDDGEVVVESGDANGTGQRRDYAKGAGYVFDEQRTNKTKEESGI